ncbi:MAG: septum formation protein Maf [Armatimonadetes bacterium]|nr:septum formation protein Maf [Armatimonadota bacterium]
MAAGAAERRPKLVLASASPRRRELLAALGLSFDVIPSAIEESLPNVGAAGHMTLLLAVSKAEAVADVHGDAVVMGADTLVVVGDGSEEAVLGKPEDEADARRMLSMLSGATHRVVTGVAVVSRGGGTDGQAPIAPAVCRCEVVTTRVVFRTLSEPDVRAYVASGEPMDKAGAYAIQGGASRFVARVEGDYYNVVGLGLDAVIRLLRGLVPVPDVAPPPPPTRFPVFP